MEELNCLKQPMGRSVKENHNVIKPRLMRKESEKFHALFEQRGLFYTAKHSKSRVTRIKAIIPKVSLR